MKIRRSPVFIALTALLSFCAVGIVLYFWSARNPPVYPHTRTIRYGFSVHNPTSRLIKDAGFWVYAPIQLTPSQKRLTIKTSVPNKVSRDELGNERLEFSMVLPPYGTKEVWVESQIAMADKPNAIDSETDENVINGIVYHEANAPEITSIAASLQKNKPQESARATYDWVKSKLQNSGYIKDDLGALYALRTHQGDCTEYAYLTASLLQAEKIPVRVMAGFVVPQNQILSPDGYHNWAEYYDQEAWHLVDPQKEAFLDGASKYIAMRVVGDLGVKGNDNSQRFFAANGAVQVKMITPKR